MIDIYYIKNYIATYISIFGIQCMKVVNLLLTHLKYNYMYYALTANEY